MLLFRFVGNITNRILSNGHVMPNIVNGVKDREHNLKLKIFEDQY